ncbi:hypothetical protein HG530_014581 [Fusarium avenaceum]|nr:hypothetical protein HG530_014581 [Fusarium avenaceum]
MKSSVVVVAFVQSEDSKLQGCSVCRSSPMASAKQPIHSPLIIPDNTEALVDSEFLIVDVGKGELGEEKGGLWFKEGGDEVNLEAHEEAGAPLASI